MPAKDEPPNGRPRAGLPPGRLSFSLRELAEYWERDESDLKELVTTGKLRAHLLLLNAIEGESARGRVQLPAGHYRLHKESAHTLFTGRWVRQLTLM